MKVEGRPELKLRKIWGVALSWWWVILCAALVFLKLADVGGFAGLTWGIEFAPLWLPILSLVIGKVCKAVWAAITTVWVYIFIRRRGDD